jgi:type III secretory pathway component EscT
LTLPGGLAAAGALLLARIAPLYLVSPLLGGQRVAAPIRAGLAVLTAAVMAPAASGVARHPPAAALLVGFFVKELVLGLALALLVSVVFWGSEVAGRLIDAARGGLAVDGGSDTPSPFGQAWSLLAIVVFFTAGGHRSLLLALARSYEVIPITALPAGSGVSHFGTLLFATTARLFTIALLLALPVLLVLFLGDLIVAVLGRAVPWIHAQAAAVPLRGLLVAATLMLGAGLVAPRISTELLRSFQALGPMLELLRP